MEEMITLILEHINEKTMILVPVLWGLGMILKRLEKLKDKYIPLILLVLGVGLANLYLSPGVESSLQGILAVLLAIFGHQLKKQSQKAE